MGSRSPHAPVRSPISYMIPPLTCLRVFGWLLHIIAIIVVILIVVETTRIANGCLLVSLTALPKV